MQQHHPVKQKRMRQAIQVPVPDYVSNSVLITFLQNGHFTLVEKPDPLALVGYSLYRNYK